MAITRFSLRLPNDLHRAALREVKVKKDISPGYSLNNLICEALRNHVDNLEAQRKRESPN